MRKPVRAWGAGGVAVAGLLLAAGCSPSPPPPEVQAAQDTRAAVAGEYWRVLSAIAPALFPDGGGTGQFVTCQPAGGGSATQVAYTVTNGLLSQGGRLDTGPFVSKLEQLLQAKGWSAFTAQNGQRVSTSGDYRVQLQPVTGNASLEANLTVSGPCVTVGTAFASAAPHLKLHDGYANADVTASPTPTSPLPTP